MWYDEEEPKPESVEVRLPLTIDWDVSTEMFGRVLNIVFMVQDDYWRIVREGSQHVTSQIVHIDTKNCGSAFPTKKESPYSK